MSTASWLEACRNAIMDSPEWEAMSRSIYQRLLQTLAEDRIGHFSDLSPDEQAAYISKLEERLSMSPSYPNFMRKLSIIVDKSVTNAADSVGKELFPNRTRLERILEISAAGAAKIIADTPDTTPEKVLQQLQILRNAPLTSSLRKFVWRLCLSMPSIRASFEEYQLNRSEILREEELNIAEKCNSVLLTSYPDLVSNPAYARIMRIVLSFFDKEVAPLQPAHYHLIIPPLICYIQNSIDTADLSGHVLEHMAAFEKISYCSKIGDPEYYEPVLLQFKDQLKTKDPELFQQLFSILSRQSSTGSESEPGVRRAVSDPLSQPFEGILEEIFRYCFVRICSISTMMFIWDQLVLSRWENLPQYAVGFLICLRQHLLQCNSKSALTQIALNIGPHLLQTSLQQTMASVYGIQRPKVIFEDHITLLDAPGSANDSASDYMLPTFAKFDVDVSKLHPVRIQNNMKLWKKRCRQIAIWALYFKGLGKDDTNNKADAGP